MVKWPGKNVVGWCSVLRWGGGGGDQMTHQEAKLGEGQGVLMRGEYQGRAQLRS